MEKAYIRLRFARKVRNSIRFLHESQIKRTFILKMEFET
jgi:hypothetical protein